MPTTPETPCEEKFIRLLDDYSNLLPDQDHIGFDEEYLRRQLVFYTTDQLFAATRGLIKVLTGLTDVIERTSKGEMRQAWAAELRPLASEITQFARVLNECHELRYH